MNKLVIIFCLFVFVQPEEIFNEKLLFEQVNHDQVYAFFNFSTIFEYNSSFAPKHYNLFPRAIGQLIQKYNVAEFHFTMTQGFWKHEQWGYPYAPSPAGAQLWVWFHKNTKEIDKKWIGFTNSLSGLFCASLNFMNKGVTAIPKISFRPLGVVENGKVDINFLRYAELGRENLCTENLTPWMKLLPCGSMSGLGSLLNPRQLQHSRFFSIGLHFKHNCFTNSAVCISPFVELQQHVSVVFDVRELRVFQKKFSFTSLFGEKLKPACPVAVSSSAMFKSSEIKPQSDLLYMDAGYYHLNLKNITKAININFKWFVNSELLSLPSVGITHHCYISGTGLNGGLQCSLTNDMRHNVTIIFFQVVPWYLHVQLHTLKLKYNYQSITPKRILYTPAVIRESPHCLEIILILPMHSIVNLQLEFTRGFLTWVEHPPDANHGFYISPSVVTIQTLNMNLSKFYSNSIFHVYSEPLLINIPVPDFSMPYNVICLVSTVLAISFGTFYNLTVKRMYLVSLTTPHPIKNILNKLTNLLLKKKV